MKRIIKMLMLLMTLFVFCNCTTFNVFAAPDTIQFGEYPQTKVDGDSALYSTLKELYEKNNTSVIKYQNERYAVIGKQFFKYEPISWVVLSGSGSQAFLMTEKVIATHSFGTVDSPGGSWDTSSVREWCNTYFLDNAFSSAEKKCIIKSSYDSCDWSKPGEIVTSDYVILPEHKMVETLPDSILKGVATDFVIASGTTWGTDNTIDAHDYYTRCLESYYGVYDLPIYVHRNLKVNAGTGAGNWTRGIRPCITANIELISILETEKTKDIALAKVTLSQTTAKYTGSPITPSVTVKYDTTKLKKDTDYIVEYADNKYVGDATVIIKGIGQYTGITKKTFSITSPGKIKITFNANGGTVNKKTKSVSRGAKYGTLPIPTRKGYDFKNWYTAKSGGSKIKEDSYVKLTKNSTLYAHWKAVTYQITYDLDGGKNSANNPTSYTVTTSKIILKNPTKKGYTFSGWYSNSGKTKKVTSIAKGSTEDKKLYAKWTANKYTIKFDGNGATSGKMSSISAEYGKKYTLPYNSFKRNGYSFLYWDATIEGESRTIFDNEQITNLSSKNNDSVKLKAVWQKKMAISESEGTMVTLNEPSGSKPGFTYSAVYSDKYFTRANSLNVAQAGLAKLSAVAAMSTYGKNGEKAQTLLDSCGFKDITPFVGKSSKAENDNHNSSVYVGWKPLSDDTVLVAALINGYTNGGYEWISNFDLGTDIDHRGFDIASNKVLKSITNYINSKNLKNVKLWITGHSRGGALTNMVSIKMIDTGIINATKVYAYGFATPQYTTRKGTGYGCIINYVSPHDFVPYVAPAEWGYKRFGQNVIFDDSVAGTARVKYLSYINEGYMDSYYPGSTSMRKKILKAFIKLGQSPSLYSVQQTWALDMTLNNGTPTVWFSPEDVAKKGIALFQTDLKDEGLKNSLYYASKSAEAAELIGLLAIKQKGPDQYITHTHSMLMYLAWIDTLYPISGQSIGLFS